MNTLSGIWCENIFSQSVANLFIHLTESSQNISFDFYEVMLINFFFTDFFSVMFKNSPTSPSFQRFSPMLYSKSFIVLHFKYMILFALNSVKVVRFKSELYLSIDQSIDLSITYLIYSVPMDIQLL